MSGWGTIYNNTRAALHLHAQKMARLQEQAASGARINRASDDPSDAYRLMKLRAHCQNLGEYAGNLAEVTRTMELGYSVMQQISADLHTIVEKLQQAGSGTYGHEQRAIIAEEIDAILRQAVSLVNTNSLGRYMFSGAKSNTAPYVLETDGRYVTAVRYQGSTQDLPVPVAPGVEMPGTLIGERIFRGDDRREPEIAGNTGAAAGTGTSSVRGSAYLQVTHKETTVIADPDAVNLKASTTAGAVTTALGQYDIVVNMTDQTIGFAGGPTKSFTGTETALELYNADGDKVCLDVSALNGALVGEHTVRIRSDASLSLAGGTPVTVSDFTNTNVAVTDADGRVLYVDATGIRRTGAETVRIPGTFDLFQTLIDSRDALLNRGGLSSSDQMARIRDSMEAVREVLADLTQSMTSVGGRLQALDTLDRSIEDLRVTAEGQAGAIENADLIQIAAELARTQTLYEMTLATASKLLGVSLLDYI